ncbi:MAG TPA: ABC transporter transmembrane domain-containing protein, partial [Jatrophihabitantaceae bacterium]|nr:ABC transporter transmembrane domain-containing protein [Jatrophihabitantaceae bacterium]
MLVSMDSMHMMRSMWSMSRRDSSVVKKQIPPGTWKRILRFARPYRVDLIVFLVIVVLDALIGVATPVLAGKVVNEITKHGEVRVVVKIAIVIAALAVLDALLSFAQRWYSARIGEGLIFDMRTAVFDHVQRMPLA